MIKSEKWMILLLDFICKGFLPLGTLYSDFQHATKLENFERRASSSLIHNSESLPQQQSNPMA
jgi:hypothetical protein